MTYAYLQTYLTEALTHATLLQALGLMEVRTVLVSLLSRFWFELAPSMGKADAVKRNQQIALTLKIAGGLRLLCKQHNPDEKAGSGRTSSSAWSRN